ncbi:MAG: hypothetical protein ILP16_11635 [Spirochaetales bacterium]|nr:hypothetical protein [Spirochaetales bacterium]
MARIVNQEALDYIANKRLKPAFSYEDVWKEEHTRAFTVAKCMDLQLLYDIQESLAENMAAGRSFKDWAAGIEQEMQQRGWWGVQKMTDPLTGEEKDVQLGCPRRLKTIYETNMRQAYASGNEQRGMESQAHEYAMYRIGNSLKHREEHVSWDGLILPKDDPWWETHTPPNGWGCKCYKKFLTAAEAKRLGATGIPDENARVKGNPGAMKPVKYNAPLDIPVSYVNKRTGKTYIGVKGITPGFEYNPGSTSMRDMALSESALQSSQKYMSLLNGKTEPTEESLKTPVSKGITSTDKYKDQVEIALKAIDKVHGDGSLPGASVKGSSNLKATTRGKYLPRTRDILVNAYNNTPAITILHEIGHYIDENGIKKVDDSVKMASEAGTEKMQALIGVLKESDSVKLGDYLYGGTYFASNREMFARAYAQYIALKSGDPVLLKQLEEVSSTGFDQWSQESFRPIAKAFDDLFEEEGWLKRK